MASVKLKWTPRFAASEFRIYRSLNQIDRTSLPTPLATLGPDAREYVDMTVSEGLVYRYLLATVNSGAPEGLAFSEVVIQTTGEAVVILPPPTYGSAGTYSISSSATTLSVNYPADIEAGQLILMAVMHRSTLTIPAGWTSEVISDAFSPFGNGQRTQIISKVASGAESGSINITQSSANRFIAQMFSINPFFGARSSLSNTGTQSSPVFQTSAIPSQGKKAVVFGALSIAQTLNSGTTSWSVDSGWTLISPSGGREGNRLAVAYQETDVGFADANGVGFTHSNTTNTAYGTATLIIPEN